MGGCGRRRRFVCFKTFGADCGDLCVAPLGMCSGFFTQSAKKSQEEDAATLRALSGRLCVASSGRHAQIIVLNWRLNEVIGRFMLDGPLTRQLCRTQTQGQVHAPRHWVDEWSHHPFRETEGRKDARTQARKEGKKEGGREKGEKHIENTRTDCPHSQESPHVVEATHPNDGVPIPIAGAVFFKPQTTLKEGRFHVVSFRSSFRISGCLNHFFAPNPLVGSPSAAWTRS